MSAVEQSSCRDRYLDLLQKSITNTLFLTEPDPDNPNRALYTAGVFDHYIKGQAVTFLPKRRLDNLRACIAEIVEKGIPGDLIETGV